MESVTLNPNQRLYVITEAEGFSCLGFDNARDLANQIAGRLGRPDLAFSATDEAALTGYAKYRQATHAWGQSPQSRQTYFDPHTEPEVARVLESCRRTGNKVRLILGNTMTGQTWFDEFDVVGRIGRSTGWRKVPLLIEDGEVGGGAILTACLLSIVDWQSGRTLFRHAAYQPPALRIAPTGDTDRPWAVQHREKDLARFQDIGKAGAHLAFMRGETIEPRVFQ